MDWINIKDRLPNDNEVVLIYCPDAEKGFEFSVTKFSKGIFYMMTSNGWSADYDEWNITQWIQLPQVPKAYILEPSKEERERLIVQMMQDDEKDGLYDIDPS